MGHAGQGAANGDHRGGVERVVTWVRAGLWPRCRANWEGGCQGLWGTERDRLEVIGTRRGRRGRCNVVGGGGGHRTGVSDFGLGSSAAKSSCVTWASPWGFPDAGLKSAPSLWCVV